MDAEGRWASSPGTSLRPSTVPSTFLSLPQSDATNRFADGARTCRRIRGRKGRRSLLATPPHPSSMRQGIKARRYLHMDGKEPRREPTQHDLPCPGASFFFFFFPSPPSFRAIFPVTCSLIVSPVAFQSSCPPELICAPWQGRPGCRAVATWRLSIVSQRLVQDGSQIPTLRLPWFLVPAIGPDAGGVVLRRVCGVSRSRVCCADPEKRVDVPCLGAGRPRRRGIFLAWRSRSLASTPAATFGFAPTMGVAAAGSS